MDMPMQNLVIPPQGGHGKERFLSLFWSKKSSILDKEEFNSMQMAIVQFPT